MAITPEKEEPKRLKTAEVSVARGAVETEVCDSTSGMHGCCNLILTLLLSPRLQLYVKKDSGSIIAELQTALIKERIKNGWDLEEVCFLRESYLGDFNLLFLPFSRI